MILESILSPKDVKRLNIKQLHILASEMRKALLSKVSNCGGHIGPNLGVVELTIGLHYVFDSPKDKIVFDVSHQSYCHKMLTGRAIDYIDLTKADQVSGYTNPDESEHDLFNVGHTSTSISLATGLAKARDLAGDRYNVIAVIGDGALSGGEAYEGLDNGAELNSNFIVVVNDNEMSIAENHGGLYGNLQRLRDSNGKCQCNFFKSLGYDYYYLEEGNTIDKVIELFKKIKDIQHPVVLHIHTKKGFGYSFAEKKQEEYHWKPSFDLKTGENKRKFSGENYDDIINQFLLDKMKQDPSVAVLVAAVPSTIGFTPEKRQLAGKQFIDVGIAEEHAVAMAAGIAKNHGKPVFATHSSFFQRTYDQISQEVCINNLPVTLLVRNASIWGLNDVTHLGIFDIPLLSNIPNLVYLAPTNCEEYLSMVEWSLNQREHPVAIRIPKNGVHHTSFPVSKNYSLLNKYLIKQYGKDVAIIALGDFFQIGEEIARKISEDLGFVPTLINPRFITGLDKECLTGLLNQHKIILTLEDGILDGGFGQKIASFLGCENIKVLNYGLKKEFIDRYSADEVLQQCRITPELVLEDVKKQLL